MESIWEDLCKKADKVPSPARHENVLNEREESLKQGKDEFIDWERARKNIKYVITDIR